MKKVICAECEKIFIVHQDKLKDFKCDECECDDYKDWDYRKENNKNVHEKKNQNPHHSPFIQQQQNPPKPVQVDIKTVVATKPSEPPKQETIIGKNKEEVLEENEYVRNNIVRELVPYIKNSNLKEITISYEHEEIEVYISLKNVEYND